MRMKWAGFNCYACPHVSSFLHCELTEYRGHVSLNFAFLDSTLWMVLKPIYFSPSLLPHASPGFRHLFHDAAAAKSLQSCPTLCDPTDISPPGSPVPGILQARTLEWFAISFSNAGKWKVKVKSLSCVWLLATPWTTAYQAPPSMGFSRQEYWSGLPLPSPLSHDSYDKLLMDGIVSILGSLQGFFSHRNLRNHHKIRIWLSHLFAENTSRL